MCKKATLLALSVTCGCVYPGSDPTGVELSWQFSERNEVDGEDAVRGRSCTGALAEELAFEVTDVDDPLRHATLRFDCAVGYQTATDLQLAASDAFIQLHPGEYLVRALAVDDATNAVDNELLSERQFSVDDSTVAIQTWDFRRETIDWTLELAGTDGCTSMSLALRYADPDDDLVGLAPDEDIEALPPYRVGLRSDRDLTLSGEAISCAAGLAGTHRFENLDRGRYQLAVELDGAACSALLDLRAPQDGSSVIDLANLPCDS